MISAFLFGCGWTLFLGSIALARLGGPPAWEPAGMGIIGGAAIMLAAIAGRFW
jgi:glucose dehydrogenase